MQGWTRGLIGDMEEGFNKDFGIGLMYYTLVEVEVLRMETETGSRGRQRLGERTEV